MALEALALVAVVLERQDMPRAKSSTFTTFRRTLEHFTLGEHKRKKTLSDALLGNDLVRINISSKAPVLGDVTPSMAE